ncbi:hypothetical protein RRG08_061183 [Elysia crispata]|uniref:Major facilitator superfamily (MFS) profile domain-containing protein n=1 Tax=Elysia crispata TaxID=231223 RepID=A0AAE0ZMU8_9GAST|nr:hypothetical protein RRG08_061183 [Elysia crispata]
MDEDRRDHPPVTSCSSTNHDPLLVDQVQSRRMSRSSYTSHDQRLNRDMENIGPPKWRSQRVILGYFLFAGMANLFFQRVNFSVNIVCMVNHTAIENHGHHRPHFMNSTHDSSPDRTSLDSFRPLLASHVVNSSSKGQSISQAAQWEEEEIEFVDDVCITEAFIMKEKQEDGPFVWSKQEQGLLLGSIYWTYTAAVVPANHLLRKVRRKTILIVSMGTLTASTLALHGAALWSLWAVFALKLVQGVCTAVAIIAMYGMWTVWGPPNEMGQLLGFNLSGQMFSNVVVFPISALLCKYGFLGGWPSVFYVFGIISAVWLLLFCIFVAEAPWESRYITEEEKDYIVSSKDHSVSAVQVKIPWKAILTSRVMWAMCFAQVSFAWNYFMFLATLPQYMFEVLKFNIESNGVFSMLPYIVMFLSTYTSGPLSDCAIKRGWVRVVWARRISVMMANLLPAACLVALSFLDCSHKALAIVLLVIGVGSAGYGLNAFQLVPFDVAPRFAPAMLTFSTSMACLTGLITPYVVALIAKDQTREQWQIVFFLTSGILVIGALGFCLLTSGELQRWAMVDPENTQRHDNERNIEVHIEVPTEEETRETHDIEDDLGNRQQLIAS